MLSPPAGIKIETAPTFDRNWYRAQTGLQILMAIIVLAGLSGLFGGGWLSSKVVRLGPVEITYDRFARKTVPFRIVVRAVDGVAAGPVELTLGRDLTDKAGIIRTVPTAAASKETPDGTTFVFASENSRAQITVSVQPDRFGIFEWKLGIAGVGETSLFQIIYP